MNITDIVVTVNQGSVRGKVSKNYKNGLFYSFFGIPYANSPVGSLRFKAPQPPDRWVGILDGTQEKEGCISRNTYTGRIEGTEDCLFLNVFTPAINIINLENPSKLKPVIVYIHGGAFHSGSTKIELFGPDFFLTQDVVLVTVSYRLGALGFSCLEDDSLGVPGNHAMRDVIMALKWIHKNINSFLGDHFNITLMGESSGAVMCHYIMLSPLAKGLFHKIILQSGTALMHWSVGRRDSLKKLAESLGLSTDIDAEILEYTQKVPIEILFAAQEKVKTPISPHIQRHFYPVIETGHNVEPAIISEEPRNIISRGDYTKIPMLIGYTSDEGLFFNYQIKKILNEHTDLSIVRDFENLVPHHLGLKRGSSESRNVARKIKEFYFDGKDPKKEDEKQFYDHYSDNFFKYIAQNTAKRHLRSVGHPIYFFRFSVDGRLNLHKIMQGVNQPGATHSDDLCYMFKMSKTPEIEENSIEDLTIMRMVTLWANFARTGNPNPEPRNSLLRVKWEPIEEDNLTCLNVDEELTIVSDPEKKNMIFWDHIYNKSALSKL